MTWQLPQEEIFAFLHIISTSLSALKLSLNEVEVLFGKLQYFLQHTPAMDLLAAETLNFFRYILSQYSEGWPGKTDVHTYKVPALMKHDLQTLGAIMRFSMENPLPIVAPRLPSPFGMITAFTDISGSLHDSPSLGIFLPTTVQYEAPLVASLAFPHSFLNRLVEEGKRPPVKPQRLKPWVS